jgi:hypothetical protein
MKSISNSDFSLLMEKLPIVLHYTKANLRAADTKTANALRMLLLLQRKLIKQNPKHQQKK